MPRNTKYYFDTKKYFNYAHTHFSIKYCWLRTKNTYWPLQINYSSKSCNKYRNNAQLNWKIIYRIVLWTILQECWNINHKIKTSFAIPGLRLKPKLVTLYNFSYQNLLWITYLASCFSVLVGFSMKSSIIPTRKTGITKGSTPRSLAYRKHNMDMVHSTPKMVANSNRSCNI